METTTRMVVKALSWQLLGLIVMAAIGYILTGSLQTAGSFALLTSAIGLVTFVLHEKLWARIPWGRRS